MEKKPKERRPPEPDGPKCPQCGLDVPVGAIRCPRCRALLVHGCTGSCASCRVAGCGAKQA